MLRRSTILIVAQTRAVADAIVPWLDPETYDVVVVRSFARAKVHLDLQPDLLISELRLGEYNGLHLALRGQSSGVPAIVIGEPDRVLEREAQKLAATYVRTTEPLRDRVLLLVPALLRQHASRPAGGALAWIRQSESEPASTRLDGVRAGKHSKPYN